MSPSLPRVIRCQSPETGEPAFGLVLEQRGGSPTAALNLTAQEPSLGSSFTSFGARGFELAKRLQGQLDGGELKAARWVIEPEHLLPPVDISDEDIAERRRFILSMGLNFRSHREETARGSDLIMVNAVGTTGPHDPLTLIPQALLPDIEAEVGCVLLEDIDLADVPPMAELEHRLAYFVVNDINDRAPMILDEVDGYTAGKSDPGYVPIGPWMIHGAELPIFSKSLGLEITCHVEHRGEDPERRQFDTTDRLIRDPEQILKLLGEQLEAHPDKAGGDRRGNRHPFARREGNRWVLPAGSLVLTGTPGGTALQAPRGLQRLGLLVLGGFSITGARRAFLRRQIRLRAELGYLMPGDTVETSVTHLGRQRWEVRGPDKDSHH
ncbi:fumarylacetoacetate hydrolase family protein [Candidatus Sumerlaeota bacterium]|nr:fumarylacetoacetate hydrolase family protein [Candidatus Sumerlaeota bacterium]